MNSLREAMMEIEEARSSVTQSEFRTQLESITASLQEMLDAEAGETTEGEVAFGDTEFAGSAPSDGNLLELERSLNDLAENAEPHDVRTRLATAHEKVANYRTDEGDRA